jgi:hypothetical protein
MTADSYQPIYDAVRSRIPPVSTHEVVENAARNAFDMGNARLLLAEAIGIARDEQTRPSVLYRPTLTADGDKWCALYGPDLAIGIAGFGNTPSEAMEAFDRAWRSSTPPLRTPERKDT